MLERSPGVAGGDAAGAGAAVSGSVVLEDAGGAAWRAWPSRCRSTSHSLRNGDGQRPNSGHIRLLQGIESYNHRSARHKHLSTPRYSSCPAGC